MHCAGYFAKNITNADTRKDMKFVDLKLPPKTEYIHRIKFRDDEKKRYDALLYVLGFALSLLRKSLTTYY